MPNIRTIRTSFGGGEISRELFGRLDIPKVQSGLDTCRNFIVMPHGAVSNRPGTQFVAEIKNSANQARLISFSFSESQTFAIEMGETYFRFYHDGGILKAQSPDGGWPDYSDANTYAIDDIVVSSGHVYQCLVTINPAHAVVASEWKHIGVCYMAPAYSSANSYVAGDVVSHGGKNYVFKITLDSPQPEITSWPWTDVTLGVVTEKVDDVAYYEINHYYSQSELADVHYVQSGDVITLVHPNHFPAELRRKGNLDWEFKAISFASSMPAPGTPTVVATYPTTGIPQDFQYKVTALNSLGFEESLGSGASTAVVNDLSKAETNYNTITWSAVAGAVRYNVYKLSGGTYGYIGQVEATTFKDDNITADLTRTIPIPDLVFNSTGNYPSAVCYYEQRRFFAGSLNQPQNIWGTQSSSDNNMSYSIPSQASDALRFKIAAQRANAIKHLIPALDLLVLTASTEWRVYSASNDALTPTSLTIKSQAQNGANNIQPVVVNNYVLYAAAQGGHIREMAYQWQSNGYTSADLCYLAPHLFAGKTLVDMAFSRAPTPCLWIITDDGALLGLTYVKEEDVIAWHKHDTTNGVFESLCTVTENGADVLYVIVKRTINGETKRYVELLHSRIFTDAADAFFVDCGLTYSGPAATVIKGLEHLEGQTVSVLGNGAVMAQHVVDEGKITLTSSVTKAQIGLPITADLITTPMMIQGESALGQSRVKNINKAWVRTYKTGKFTVGPDAARLTPLGANALVSEELPIFVQPNYNQEGKIMIRQADPLPITVVNITTEVSIGG